MPECTPALYWGNWGTIRLTPVLVQKGDTVTMTATIIKPDKVGWGCIGGSWAEIGTHQVRIPIPGSFDLVDFSPKADGFHSVKVGASDVTWTSLSSQAPANWVTPGCYCYNDGHATHMSFDGCPFSPPKGPFGPGSTFTLTLKTKTAYAGTSQDYWTPISATFGGNFGIPWSYDATCHFKYGGNLSVNLTANPSTLPEDGSASLLTATVMEATSGIRLPYQKVDFIGDFGIFNPPSAETNSNGVATSSLSSPGVDGPDMVQAYVPGGTGTALVTFTHVDHPPDDPRAHFGRYNLAMPVADPVHPGLGNYTYSQKLFSFPGKGIPFYLEAFYNSLDSQHTGPLGYGWTHSYHMVLTPPTAPSTDVRIQWRDGRESTYRGDGAGNFTPLNAGPSPVLTMPDGGHYLATEADQTAYLFDTAGKLLSITDLNGNGITFTHTTQLDRITDTSGRQINFLYTGGRLTSITSPLKTGNSVSFSYDASGNLAGITDARGKLWQFGYDSSHRLLTQTDARGITVLTNTYDSSGRVIQQKDGGTQTTTFEYTEDSSGTKTRITPPSGNSVWHYYDKGFNLVKIIDGLGNAASFSSDSRGLMMSGRDKKNAYRQMGFDSSGNAVSARDRTGAAATIAYNSLRRPTAFTDPLLRSNSFAYDAKGNLTEWTNPNGAKSTITVGSNGLPAAVSDFMGKTWSLAYDAAGLPVTITSPLSTVTTLTYDAAGRKTRIQTPLAGVALEITYDDSGLPLTQKDPLGQITSYDYDDNGNLLRETFVPNGAVTSFTYDWANRPLTATDAQGGITRFGYDADGNLASITDPDGIVITRQYDQGNRLISETDPLGHRVFYGYDANGNVTSVQNELSATWRYEYDAENRVIRETDPMGNATRLVYDKAGQITSITGPLKDTTAYLYDAAGNLSALTMPDQSVVSYGYNANGRATAVSDPLSRIWTFAYDALGRMTSQTDPNGKTENFTYDALNRITRKVLRDAAEITYAYDANSRLTALTLPGQTIAFEYDSMGNMTRATDHLGSAVMTYDRMGRLLSRTDAHGKTVAFAYTPAGRLSAVVYPGSKTVNYNYDSVGRLSSLTDWRSNQTSYQYDAVNRITGIALPNGTKTLFLYDAAGRITSRTYQKSGGAILAQYNYTYLADGKIAAVQGSKPKFNPPPAAASSFSHDPMNRLLSSRVNSTASSYAFDLRGNLTSKVSAGVTTTYQYDALNRLTSVSNGTDTTAYTYDAAGNRLSKTYNGTVSRYVRHGNSVFCLLDGGGGVTSYHIYAGAMLYSLSAAGDIAVYHQDERGSVVAVTDAAQNIVQSYAYDGYGRMTGSSGGGSHPFRFVGGHGVMADENGLYYMQARYYDPDLRRFISEDPIGLSAGLNLYGYVSGNPVSHIDPQGLQTGEAQAEAEWIQQVIPVQVKSEEEALHFWFYEGAELGYRDAGKLVSTNPIQIGNFKITPEMQESYASKVFGGSASRWRKFADWETWKYEGGARPDAVKEILQSRPTWEVQKRGTMGKAYFLEAEAAEKPLAKGLLRRTVGGSQRFLGGALNRFRAGPLYNPVGLAAGVFDGFFISDVYLSQGQVWDSRDQSWKSWDQYQDDHPNVKAIYDIGGLRNVTGGTEYLFNWVFSQGERSAYSYLDGLKKKPRRN